MNAKPVPTSPYTLTLDKHGGKLFFPDTQVEAISDAEWAFRKQVRRNAYRAKAAARAKAGNP